MAERQVDDADVVERPVGDDPFDAGDDVAREAAAVRAEHPDVDESRAGGDAARIVRRHAIGQRRAAGDDPGDVRAVTEGVGDLRVAAEEAHTCHDATGERRVRRDAGIDNRDANALPVDAGNAEHPREHAVTGARLIRRRGGVRDVRRGMHRQIARQTIDRPVTRQIAQFGAVGEHHGCAAHAPDDAETVARGQQFQLAIGPMHDDALPRVRPARQMPGQIGGEMRASAVAPVAPPIALLTPDTSVREHDQRSDDEGQPDGPDSQRTVHCATLETW